MIVIEELHAQIDAVRDKLALAEQAGLSYEANLHRAAISMRSARRARCRLAS